MLNLYEPKVTTTEEDVAGMQGFSYPRARLAEMSELWGDIAALYDSEVANAYNTWWTAPSELNEEMQGRTGVVVRIEAPPESVCTSPSAEALFARADRVAATIDRVTAMLRQLPRH